MEKTRRSSRKTSPGITVQNLFLKKQDDPRLTGYIPRQQNKLVRRITKRRGKGKPCSTKWIRNEMFIICKEDMPPGFDPSNKKQFGSRWCDDFMDRKGLSVRRRTNKKKTSVFERLHMIHGYHAYTQYQMAFAEISSEEEESSSTDESS